MVVVLKLLKILRNIQVLEPPLNAKSFHFGNIAAFQNVEANPGHEAEFRPALLMYQLEHPAEKTVCAKIPSRLLMNFSSASGCTSTTFA
jgi:hypothetical protein